ncbi:MAG: cytochrome o ubiquinol oxidase subunit IV [Pseudomonadota bacterium]
MSDHAHDDHHGHGGHPQSTYRGYAIGFALSVLLTVIPFGIVMFDLMENAVGWAIAIIFVLGGIQILVHVQYFLHVTLGAEDGWQAMSLAFTGVLLVIILGGSIWVMFHLEENMMPAHELIERVEQLP